MQIERNKIGNIPSIIWGRKSNKVFIAIHGNMSNKEDKVIKILADKVINKGYQLLNIDHSVWCRYEQGKTLIPTSFLYTFCKTFKISADYLLGRIEEPKYF